MTSFPVPNRTDLESLNLNRQNFPPAAGFSKVNNNLSLRKLILSHLSRPTLENLAVSRPTQSRPSEIGRGNYAPTSPCPGDSHPNHPTAIRNNLRASACTPLRIMGAYRLLVACQSQSDELNHES